MLKKWLTQFLCRCCRNYLHKRLYSITTQLELANQAKATGLMFPTRRYTHQAVADELKALLRDLDMGKDKRTHADR